MAHFLQACGEGKAKASASFFHETGEFEDVKGDAAKGPADIEKTVSEIFAGPEWARNNGRIEGIKFVGGSVAVAIIEWESTEEV